MAQERIFHDTLTVGSDTALTAHTPDTGDGYTQVHLEGTEVWEARASSDDAAPTATGTDEGQALTLDATYPSANYQLVLTAVAMPTGSDDFLRIYTRYTAQANNGYYVAELSINTGTDPELRRATGATSETASLDTTDNSGYDVLTNGDEVILQAYNDDIILFAEEIGHLYGNDGNITAAGKAAISFGTTWATNSNGGDASPTTQIFDDIEVWNLSENETGWNDPTTTGEVDNDFTNPTNAYASGGGVTTFDEDTGVGVDAQDYGDFGMSIPAGSVINGISVLCSTQTDGSGSHDLAISVSKNNGSTWSTEKVIRWEDHDSSQKIKFAGHARSLWGDTWSADDFTDANFRIRVRLAARESVSVDDIEMDHVAVNVYYDQPDGPTDLTATANGTDIDLEWSYTFN